MNPLGKVHIYTGDGKGKTTSAVGLAVRALGHDLRVCYVYFHKQPEKYGYNEIQNLEKLGARILGFAKGHPHCDTSISPNNLKTESPQGLFELKELLEQDSFDLMILDEIIISVRDGYLEEDELLKFISGKPKHLELVLTGRGATERMIELADYVTNMTKIRHPYDYKITSREGIEY